VYRCEANSVEGFVQQLAVAYIAKGYRFYVACRIPPHKDPSSVDRKLVARYGLGISRWTRARRKRQGVAGVQYLRYRRFFVLIATHGKHEFFGHERRFRDIREKPIGFVGYSIGCRTGRDGRHHVSVEIHRDSLRKLKDHLERVALRWDVEQLIQLFQVLGFAPYARVRRQLLKLLSHVNDRRRRAGLESVPWSAVRWRRRSVSPFVRADCVVPGIADSAARIP